MEESTKNLLYTALDIIELLTKNNLSKIGFDEYVIARNELVSLVHKASSDLSNLRKNNNENILTELIGILPSLLIDKQKFPSNKDLVRFSEHSFNIIVPSWEKKKREEIIGRVVYMIANKSPLELKKFTEGWKEFNKDERKSVVKEKNNYVDSWLSFFENYSNKK